MQLKYSCKIVGWHALGL